MSVDTKGWLKKLTKDFGMLASEIPNMEKPCIPSWSPSLNWALDTASANSDGGWKPGKISILYGAENAGKSMLAAMAIIEQQRRDPDAIAVWFDAEFSFASKLFSKLGGDLSRVIVRKSNDPVKIFDYIGGELLEMLQDGAPIKAIVIDSIKSIRYPKDIKKVSTDQTMGGNGAPYLTSALKMVIPVVAEHNLLTFFVQQCSQQLDPMKALRNPYVVPDGNALKHAADFMLEITKVETKAGVIESGETISGAAAQLGHKIRVKVRKNRCGAPARMAQFTFHYDKGIVDTGLEIYDLGKALGVITHPINPDTGKPNVMMWTVGDHAPIRGEPACKAFVVGSKEVQDEVMAACTKAHAQKLAATDDPETIEIDYEAEEIETRAMLEV